MLSKVGFLCSFICTILAAFNEGWFAIVGWGCSSLLWIVIMTDESDED